MSSNHHIPHSHIPVKRPLPVDRAMAASPVAVFQQSAPQAPLYASHQSRVSTTATPATTLTDSAFIQPSVAAHVVFQTLGNTAIDNDLPESIGNVATIFLSQLISAAQETRISQGEQGALTPDHIQDAIDDQRQQASQYPFNTKQCTL